MIRKLWRQYVSRRWVYLIQVNHPKIRPIYDETMSGLSTFCPLNKQMHVVLIIGQLINKRQREIIKEAHSQCHTKSDMDNYDKILREYILNK